MGDPLAFDIKLWAPTEKAIKAGIAFGGFYRDRFYAMLLTYRGGLRGNHIHPHDQHTILLSGRAKYLVRKDGVTRTFELEPGSRLDVEAGIPHVLVADEEILTLEWWDGEFKEEPHVILDIQNK